MGKTFAASVVATLMAIPSASATAAVVDGGSPMIYRASPGEVNAVELGEDLGGQSWPWFEYRSPLMAGNGCVSGPPVTCLGYRAEVFLGNRDDVARVNPHSGFAKVYGEGGDDDFVTGGTDQAWGYGGNGDDTIRVATGGEGTVDGGPGDDRIVTGQADVRELYDGGPGNDLIVGRSSRSRLIGANGDDAIVLRETWYGATLTGDAGDDTLIWQARGKTSAVAVVDGGRGDDVVSGLLGGLSVDAGPGDDRIDVTGDGAVDRVSCGKGRDIVWANPDDTIAEDCELRLDGPPSTLFEVAEALERADVLAAHRPDPNPDA